MPWFSFIKILSLKQGEYSSAFFTVSLLDSLGGCDMTVNNSAHSDGSFRDHTYSVIYTISE